jgi:hypothetical protein
MEVLGRRKLSFSAYSLLDSIVESDMFLILSLSMIIGFGSVTLSLYGFG